jgi:hypothetical protein
MLQMLLEDTQKNIQIGKCQIIVFSFLLNVDSERQTFYGMWWDASCPRSLLNIHVLEVSERQPTVSTRCLCNSYRQLPCLRTPYFKRIAVVSLLQSVCARVVPHNAYPRHAVCQWMLQQWAQDPMFTEKVLFNNKSLFSGAGIPNIHNEHAWSDENFHAVWSHHYQWQFSINLWAGVSGNCLIGPHILLTS